LSIRPGTEKGAINRHVVIDGLKALKSETPILNHGDSHTAFDELKILCCELLRSSSEPNIPAIEGKIADEASIPLNLH
jgi:hypothetical protein